MRNSISAIIPFYNEGIRIYAVLTAVTKVPSIKHVICVDDGSTDDAWKRIKTEFPHVTLIRLNQNIGKAQAIIEGLRHVYYQNTLLIDGDLIRLKAHELNKACKTFISHPSLDMLILKAHGEQRYALVDTLFRNYIIQSGNRILRTKDLQTIEKRGLTGYQLEVAINVYMMKHHKIVGWMPVSALNLHKTHKYSFWKGWKEDLKMDKEIMRYTGLARRIIQILFFCSTRIQ